MELSDEVVAVVNFEAQNTDTDYVRDTGMQTADQKVRERVYAYVYVDVYMYVCMCMCMYMCVACVFALLHLSLSLSLFNFTPRSSRSPPRRPRRCPWSARRAVRTRKKANSLMQRWRVAN
jgi:hypothetical protein